MSVAQPRPVSSRKTTIRDAKSAKNRVHGVHAQRAHSANTSARVRDESAVLQG
jgi:hypothetical protein